MVDDSVHYGGLREEGDDFHPASAAGTGHGIDLKDLANHGRPAFGGQTAELFLDDPKRRGCLAIFPDLPPMEKRMFVGRNAELFNPAGKLVLQAAEVAVPVGAPDKYEVVKK